MIRFNYYRSNIKDSKPLGWVTIDQFYEAISDPKPHIKQVFELISKAEQDGDMATKAELKTRLYSFTPAVQIKDSRCYENITGFTGLMPLDFDHLSVGIAQEFKSYLFETYPFIQACWLSASRSGVRAFVSIPKVNSVEEYKEYFDGLKREVMQRYNGFDNAPKNCVLPLFLSHDAHILIREDSTLWTGRYKEPEIEPRIQYKVTPDRERAIRFTAYLINKINSNGHPQLRAAAFALGGYVGAGYIDFQDAKTEIFRLIDNNNYLNPPASNGFKKANIYKKTADTMIRKGCSQPLYFK